MENQEPHENSDNTPADRRPLGYWLRVVDGLLSRQFAASLDDAAVSRRDWMLLNAVDGSVDAPWLVERLARKSGRVRRLADRGLIVQTDGGWELTDAGRSEKERLAGLVDGIRERVAGAVSPEDYATTMASLEAIARELGWDDNADENHRRHGFGPRGFGPGLRGGFGERGGHRGGERGFGHGRHGFGPGRGFGHGADHEGGHRGGRDCGGEHRHGAHQKSAHHGGERAYERGFTAGFERGRAVSSEPVA